MSKIKICPKCGTKNIPGRMECSQCSEDLIGVPAIDEDKAQVKPKRAESVSRTVRICDSCGHSNPSNARRCEQCGEEISDILPTELGAKSVGRVRLVGLDGLGDFDLPEGETVIGKEQAMSDLLGGKAYVSRCHGRFIRENGRLFYENLSQSNFTYIDNVKTVSGRVELHDGNVLGLGGNEVDGKRQDKAAYCRVHIEE